MDSRESTDITSWIAKTTSSPSDLELCELLAAKCANVASILKNGSLQDLSRFLGDIPAIPETFELVARFCDGYEVHISAENVVPLSCLAHYLGMTENHSKNNLLKKVLIFFEQKVLPSWNEAVKALRTTENILNQAVQIGLVGACLESLIAKALSDPSLLGDPINKAFVDDESEADDDEDNDYHHPSARRRLFVLNWQSEDLITLSLRLYEPLIHEMIKRGVPSKYVVASLVNYVKRWVFPAFKAGENLSVYKRNSQREIVEAVERLLPHENGLIPCTILFEILQSAIYSEASLDCRDGLEFRIGTSLHQATVKDLLILSHGQAREVQYDIECVRRILKHFYGNYSSSHLSGLVSVAILIEEFLAEIASDIDLKKETFTELAEMSMKVSMETRRTSDGLYKAIDIYLDTHRHLTRSEREEVCQPLDFHKMSAEACDHAAKNERLPVRVALQVLFLAQLHLRDSIKEVQGSQDGLQLGEEEDDLEVEGGGEEEEVRLVGGGGEERMRAKMERMSSKLEELERECGVIKEQIERDCSVRVVKKEKKMSLWREMKRKFGCISTSSSVSNCNCHGKKKKKKVIPK
ncbi:NPH3 domain containing protein [Parasponia andersonii]|uniref:NPH3 domain containing protein n=1 Tax=Parasponia andersonii TaxID=3476 RepID=A0A2P5C6Q7_PARAD|nr:NPH3 domain containing protein [Parasponia andersonii]